MDDAKLHICMEAVDGNGVHYYMIHSLKLSDLMNTQSPQPAPFLETQIEGYPSMGCGFFDSKIVFAGGKLSDDNKELHNGFITFDMSSKVVSSESYPLMDHGKLKPYVFQLDKNLYVLDTQSGYRKGAFEYYNSAQQEWHNHRQPMDHPLPKKIYPKRPDPKFHKCPDPTFLPPKHPHGHPCVVIGSICYFSVPHDNALHLHHPNITYRTWLAVCGEPLPFSGMATYYNQAGFDDSVIISFTKGRVEAHQFSTYDNEFFSHELLFEILPSKSHAQKMCGYFADFGKGIYSLVASDDDFLCVYTFQVYIVGQERFEAMKLSHSKYTEYRYPINALCPGFNMLGVVGCFAPSPNSDAQKRAEEIIAKRYRWFGRRYDKNPFKVVFEGKEYPVPKKHRDGEINRLPMRRPQVYFL